MLFHCNLKRYHCNFDFLIIILTSLLYIIIIYTIKSMSTTLPESHRSIQDWSYFLINISWFNRGLLTRLWIIRRLFSNSWKCKNPTHQLGLIELPNVGNPPDTLAQDENWNWIRCYSFGMTRAIVLISSDYLFCLAH